MPTHTETAATQIVALVDMLSRHANDPLAPATLVLKHGRVGCAPATATGHPRGERKQCYRNALLLAQSHPELTYTEGWAAGLIPVEHAWCTGPDGTIVEVTWDHDPSDIYLGVGFNTDQVTEYLIEQGTYGVLANAWTRPRIYAQHILEMLGELPDGMPHARSLLPSRNSDRIFGHSKS